MEILFNTMLVLNLATLSAVFGVAALYFIKIKTIWRYIKLSYCISSSIIVFLFGSALQRHLVTSNDIVYLVAVFLLGLTQITSMLVSLAKIRLEQKEVL
jgi:hypothetical protein